MRKNTPDHINSKSSSHSDKHNYISVMNENESLLLPKLTIVY